MKSSVEGRSATFNGWWITASVEKKIALDGCACFHIVSPIEYGEFANSSSKKSMISLLEAEKAYLDIDRAFTEAFSFCAREIVIEIDSRLTIYDK